MLVLSGFLLQMLFQFA